MQHIIYDTVNGYIVSFHAMESGGTPDIPAGCACIDAADLGEEVDIGPGQKIEFIDGVPWVQPV